MPDHPHRFPDHAGHRVPEVSLRVRRNGDWATLTTAELFAHKNVVVFSLPGAFTPTCSSTHLPRYNELAPAFKDAGIDAIVCVSVNDPFVMEAWAKEQEAENVTLLPDGNGEFTRKMGLLVDKSDLNFGQRSWRYSMLVRDGVVDIHLPLRLPVRRRGRVDSAGFRRRSRRVAACPEPLRMAFPRAGRRRTIPAGEHHQILRRLRRLGTWPA